MSLNLVYTISIYLPSKLTTVFECVSHYSMHYRYLLMNLIFAYSCSFVIAVDKSAITANPIKAFLIPISSNAFYFCFYVFFYVFLKPLVIVHTFCKFHPAFSSTVIRTFPFPSVSLPAFSPVYDSIVAHFKS